MALALMRAMPIMPHLLRWLVGRRCGEAGLRLTPHFLAASHLQHSRHRACGFTIVPGIRLRATSALMVAA
jgi:hypothetical protein